MPVEQMENSILFILRIPALVLVFVVLGKSLAAKPGGPCEFPLTCHAATVFLASLERKCVLACAVQPRSNLVAAL